MEDPKKLSATEFEKVRLEALALAKDLSDFSMKNTNDNFVLILALLYATGSLCAAFKLDLDKIYAVIKEHYDVSDKILKEIGSNLDYVPNTKPPSSSGSSNLN